MRVVIFAIVSLGAAPARIAASSWPAEDGGWDVGPEHCRVAAQGEPLDGHMAAGRRPAVGVQER